MGESLVFCDVTDLVNLPVPGDPPLARLVGHPKQIRWAEQIRTGQTIKWHRDLPEVVYKSVLTIEDATWWITNRDNEASHIKWPMSWLSHSKRLNMFKPTNGPLPTPQGKTLMEVFAEEEARKGAAPAEPGVSQEERQQALWRGEAAKVYWDSLSDEQRNQCESGSPESAFILGYMVRCLRSQPEEPQAVAGSSENAEQFEAFARKVANSPELAYLTILSQMFRISHNPKIHQYYTEARERVAAHLKAIEDLSGRTVHSSGI